MRFFIYSEDTQQYFYIYEPVLDINLNKVGVVVKFTYHTGIARKENVISVYYLDTKTLRVYLSYQHKNLQKLITD
jgi:hypothetical protein